MKLNYINDLVQMKKKSATTFFFSVFVIILIYCSHRLYANFNTNFAPIVRNRAAFSCILDSPTSQHICSYLILIQSHSSGYVIFLSLVPLSISLWNTKRAISPIRVSIVFLVSHRNRQTSAQYKLVSAARQCLNSFLLEAISKGKWKTNTVSWIHVIKIRDGIIFGVIHINNWRLNR